MLPPVRCFTCHQEVGAYAEIYRKIREKRMAAYFAEKGILPEYVSSARMPHVMEGVLEDLRIGQCCRSRIVTYVDFRDVY